MGVDAYIFARKSKRFYSFDRERNLYAGDSDDYYPLMRGYAAKGASREDVMRFAQEAVTEHAADPYDWHRVHWCSEIRDFVLAMPEDEVFFTATDHDEPTNWEIAKDEGYTAWPDQVAQPTPEQRAEAEAEAREVVRAINLALRGT